MTTLTAEDALTPHIVAVTEEMRLRDVAVDPSCEAFAVFSELPASPTALQPPFLGVIEPQRVGRYPFRIFADLIPRGQSFELDRLTPLADVVSRFQRFGDNAIVVLESRRRFVGVVTRRSLIEALLEHERRQYCGSSDIQESPVDSSSEALPGGRAVQRLAAEWMLSEGQERQHIAADIHDRLRQLLCVARLRLDHTSRTSGRGPAAASAAIVDQLLEESLAYTRSLIEELTPAGLRTGELSSALDRLAFEMRQRGYQVRLAATLPSNVRLSEPINAFLYRAVRSFLRQAMGGGLSALITLSMEDNQASTVRVKTTIDVETRPSDAGKTPLLGQATSLRFGGMQACGTLLGIGVLVESSTGPRTALVLDIPLPDSSAHP